MDEAVMLIGAYAEEDRRLLELVERFPPAMRDLCPADGRLSLKQTLGHLAYWDDYAIRFYDIRCHHGVTEPLSPSEFDERNRQVLELIYHDPYEDVLCSYREATRLIVTFLRVHWSDLDDASRKNFKIPLKHRRHHRRHLQKLLESLSHELGPQDALKERAG